MLAAAQAGLGSAAVRRKVLRRLARKSQDADQPAAGAEQALAKAEQSSGTPLPADLQHRLGQALGSDVGGVRVHTAAASAEAATAVNARAYTVGDDIHFNRGEYAPSSAGGQHLLAHEVAHTVQQSGSRDLQTKLEVSDPGDSSEQEADRFADAFMSDARTSVTPAPLAALARAPCRIARVGGWGSDPKVGSWNKDSKAVAGTQRIPIEGLSSGLTQKDLQAGGSTAEAADERAIVVVPDPVDFSKTVDILLHFHGYNVGYRERAQNHPTSGPKGSVRDVEADQIEQQMAATSYQNLIAILPQGTDHSVFNGGGFNPDAYVSEVLAKLGTTLQPNVKPLRGKVIVSGHSGGGPEAVHSADALNPAAVADANDPFKQDSPLLLFDGINGTSQMDTVKSMLGRWIDSDIARCTTLGAPAAATKLQARGMRFRSTYSAGDYYGPVNTGGTHYKQVLDPSDPAKKKMMNVADWSVSYANSVKGFLENRFKGLAGQLGTLGIDGIIQQQYKVESVGGTHDRTMATGAGANPAPKDRDPTTGIPNYTAGSGNLEKGLNQLAPSSSASKAPPPPPPPPTATPVTPSVAPPSGTPDAGAGPADAGPPVGTGPDEEFE